MLPSSSRRDYKLLLTAAFLWGCGTSQLMLLSVVLNAHGMVAVLIAFVLSCNSLAILLSALASGVFASRFGAVRTLVLGGMISFVAIACLPFTLDWAPATALASFARGFGFGLLTPAGQLFAQAIADEGDRKRVIGVFTAMFLVPTFFGPAIGEFWLYRLGEAGFFVSILLVMILGLISATLLPRHHDTPAPPSSAGYLALLRDRRSWFPSVSAMQSGLAFTFANSFLPLMLTTFAVPVTGFFTPFSVGLLFTRFVGMKYLQRLPAERLILLGLAAYGMGTALLAAGGLAIILVGLAGSLYGLGYGVIIPTAVDWLAGSYPPAERARPVALINTSFHIGAIVSMQLTGGGLALMGWSGVLAVLVGIIFAVGGILSTQALVPRTAIERKSG